VDKQKTVVRAGSNGVTGVIGWYIPTYLMKQHPEFKTWKGLKGKESLFKSPESGSQGMFLGGDPSYQQKDKTLITALGLNFKFVSVGAEPAQVARWSQLYKQGKPVLFYWYDPQFLNAQYKLSQVQLPARFKGCKDDEKAGGNPKSYACAYPSYTLLKFFSSKFAKSGSPAVAVLKRFKWSNADQNAVAAMIGGQHMDKDKAAQKWIAANQAKVNVWLGK
jgi:glycine betaine/proline transport system substrate-binding protein